MKSKTSCFNKTIFLKNITHFWPIWLIILGWNLFVLPFMLYNYSLGYTDADKTSPKGFEAAQICDIASAIDDYASPGFIFIFSVLAVMAVFSYLYNSRAAYTMHALPVTRKELFVTGYISGLLFLIVPEFIGFLTGTLVSNMCGYPHTNYLLKGMLFAMGISFFFYSFTVFIAMFTGQLFAVPIFALILNILYVGCKLLVGFLLETLSYGMPIPYSAGPLDVLSPLYYMYNAVGPEYDYSGAYSICRGYFGTETVIGYALVAIVLVILAYLIYGIRNIETAGSLISIPWIAPVFRWGVAFCGAAMFALIFCGVLQVTTGKGAFFMILIVAVLSGMICFFGAQMFLEKGFRVFKKKRFIECASFLGIVVVLVVGVECDLFGLERNVPEVSDVKSAYIDCYYIARGTKPEEIEDIIKIHKEIIASKKEFEAFEDADASLATLDVKYFFKNGTVLMRSYDIPTTREYAEGTDTVIEKVAEMMNDKDVHMENLFGVNYEEAEVKSGRLSLFKNGEYSTTVDFGKEETEKLYQALLKDMENGNFTGSFGHPDWHDDTYSKNTYHNELCFLYSNKNEVSLSGEYDPGMWEPDVVDGVEEGYVKLNKNCKNLIAALIEIGAIQSEEDLTTVAEMEELE